MLDPKQTLLRSYQRNGETGIKPWVDIRLALDAPVAVDFTVEAEDLQLHRERGSHRHRYRLAENYEFSAHGLALIDDLTDPARVPCELIVNELGLSEWRDAIKEGHIGDGWFRSGELVFRLRISPASVQRLLLRRRLERRAGIASFGRKWISQQCWLALRIDITDLQPTKDNDGLCFNIQRVSA